MRLARSFSNYKCIKGFLGLILTSLYQYISVLELIHFEINLCPKPFYCTHTHQEELEALMSKRCLNIEMVLDQFDFSEQGNFFAIKFIDPKTRLFRIIRFIKDPLQGHIEPENFYNQKYYKTVHDRSIGKFLPKLLLLMTFPLHELQ